MPGPAPPSPTERRGPAPHARQPAADPPPPGLQPYPGPGRIWQSPPPPPHSARGARAPPPSPHQRLVPHLAVSPAALRSRQLRARPWACELAPEQRERDPASRCRAACRAPAASTPSLFGLRSRRRPSAPARAARRVCLPLSSGRSLGGCVWADYLTF